MAQPPPEFVATKEVHPPPWFPTFWADNILNVAHSPTTVRFYLARLDPSFVGDNKYLHQPFAQIVMPLPQFVQAAAFFEEAIEAMIRDNAVTRDQVETWRAQRKA